MDIKEYQPTPDLVEAVQVLGGQVEDVVSWINAYSNLRGIVGQTALRGRSAEYIDVQTPEGMRRAALGDYIVHDGNGAFWPTPRPIFERGYVAVAE
ncbi:hypothetical protein [Nonomuraea sp. NPDC049141]|uniref:hypothetical protein n=1 Tax=unclassified Nonomuraea TaxID=2593643 RepID=UPI0033F0F037